MHTLLDFIFDNLDIDSLDRSQVQQHLSYLIEIDSQLPATYDKVKFRRIKVLLDKRLVELDNQLNMAYPENKLPLSNEKAQQKDPLE